MKKIVHYFKQLSEQKRVTRLILLLFSFFLLITVVVGFCVRASIGREELDVSNYPNARVFYNKGKTAEQMYRDEKVMEVWDNAPYILIVNHLESRNMNSATRSLVRVKEVLRGDGVKPGETVVYFQYNYFSTKQDTGLNYINWSVCNLMNDSDDYLICASEMKMDEAYQELIDPYRHFIPEGGMRPEVFNLSTEQTEPIPEREGITYEQVKDMPFLCFSQVSLDIANHWRQMLIDRYCPDWTADEHT